MITLYVLFVLFCLLPVIGLIIEIYNWYARQYKFEIVTLVEFVGGPDDGLTTLVDTSLLTDDVSSVNEQLCCTYVYSKTNRKTSSGALAYEYAGSMYAL
jgi:hypothetical protein